MNLVQNLLVPLLSFLCILVIAPPATLGETDQETPYHVQVVVDANKPDLEVLFRSYQEWWEKADGLAGSSYTAYGFSADGARLLYSLHIPARWGANVIRAKTVFKMKGREQLESAVFGKVVGTEPGATPMPEAMPVRLVAPVGVKLANNAEGQDWPDGGVRSQPARLHTVILVDRSNSAIASCDEPLLWAFDQFLEKAGFTPGSTFIVLGVGDGIASVETLFQLTVPELTDGSGAVLAKMLASRAWLAKNAGVWEPGSKPNSSAIIEAVYVASRTLAGLEGGEKTLFCLSDMRQYTPGPRGWNFEQRIPATDAFLAALKEQALLPNLAGVDIVLAGLHYKATRPETAARLEPIWQTVFQAAGAQSIKIAQALPPVAGDGR